MNLHAEQNFPALYGQPVTERDLRLCATEGHAVYRVNGVVQETCPRCGGVR